jgi:alkanesulfonate monooxygenase SsuD/methylene tetrahydromethanopterin reductase-like flavin-dependent oxidoreductase (luciferase family)
MMVEGQEGVGWDEWAALSRAAEEAGLDGLFRSDHYTSFHGPPGAALDAWATIVALAAVTTRLRLGTLVSPATFRHPSELARVAVTADHVSGGRIEVGVGAGWFEQEHRQSGFEFPDIKSRFDRFTEYVEVLVRSWSAELFDYHGQYFVLEGQRALPAPVQRPHPPLIIGGRGGRKSLALAARFAQEYNAAFIPVDDCARLRGELDAVALDAGCEPVLLSVMTLVALGSTGEDAEARRGRMLERFRGPRERTHAGTVDEMANLLHQLEEAGVKRVFLQHPDRQDAEQIALMGELATRVGSS